LVRPEARQEHSPWLQPTRDPLQQFCVLITWIADAIDVALDAGELPNLDRLRERFKPDRVDIPDVAIALMPLSAYDELAAVRAPNAATLCAGGAA
jgi:hypothetical protein